MSSAACKIFDDRANQMMMVLTINLVCCHAATDVAPTPRRVEFSEVFDATAFQKGNIHTHTLRSDGDSTPENVIAWYRANGYAFLALTDHNRRSAPNDYASLQDTRLQLIAGEEISMTAGGRQVHVNALCTTHVIGGGSFAFASDALVWAVSEVEAQGGVALINHPNFDRALTLDNLLAVPNAPLLEIASGHPYVFSDGIEERPSHEALWDASLIRGATFMGVAVDDTHHLALDADPPAFPGRGWIEVFSATNEPASICDALKHGRLYASTGVELERIIVTRDSYTVWPDTAARVVFIGDAGELSRSDVVAHSPATYVHKHERYVRTRIESAAGRAWTPAIFAE